MLKSKSKLLLILFLVLSMMLPTNVLAEEEPVPPIEISGGISMMDSVVYTGSSFNMVISNSLSANDGADIQYSVNDGEWAYIFDEVSQAGSYTLKYRAFKDNDHKTDAFTAGTFTIERAPNEFHVYPAATSNFQFDGNPHPIYTNTPSAEHGGIITYSLTKNGGTTTTSNSIPTITDVGTYIFSCSTSNSVINYKSVESSSSTITVTPKPISVTELKASNLTYNGISQSTSITSLKTSEGDGVSVGYDVVSGESGTNAGTYTLKIKGKGNYDFEASTDWAIGQLDISDGSATVENPTLYFTGSPQTASVSSIKVGSIDLYPGDFTVTNATQTNVGTYGLTISGKNPNTTGSFTTTNSFEIKPFEITNDNVDIVLGPSLTYNGSEQTQTVTQVKIKATGAVINPSLYSVTENKGIDAGDYTLKVTGNGGNVTGSAEKQFNIAKKAVTGTWTGGPTFTYDGSTKTVYLTNLPSCAKATYTGNSASAYGNYTAKATITITGNDNYVAGNVPNYNWSIERPSYDMSGVKFISKSFGYDGKPHTIEITGKLPSGVTVKYLNNTRTAVGKQTATAIFTGDEYHSPIPNMTAEIRVVNTLIDIPKEKDNNQLADGKEKFLFDEGKGYIVEGDGKTEPGRYEVVVKLKDPKNTAWSDGTIEDKIFELVIRKDTVTQGNNKVVDKKNGFDPDAKLNIKYTEKKDDSDYKHLTNIEELLNGHQEFNYAYLVELQVDGKNVDLEGETELTLSIPEQFRGKEFELTYVHGDLVEKGVYPYEISEDGQSIILRVDELGEFIFATTDTGEHIHIFKVLTILASLLFTIIYNIIMKHHKINILVVLFVAALIGIYLYIGSFKNCDTCLILDIIAILSLLFMLYRFLKKYDDDENNKEENDEQQDNKEEETVENSEDNNEESTEETKEDNN